MHLGLSLLTMLCNHFCLAALFSQLHRVTQFLGFPTRTFMRVSPMASCISEPEHMLQTSMGSKRDALDWSCVSSAVVRFASMPLMSLISSGSLGLSCRKQRTPRNVGFLRNCRPKRMKRNLCNVGPGEPLEAAETGLFCRCLDDFGRSAPKRGENPHLLRNVAET